MLGIYDVTHQTVQIRHWLPILTFCPVNNLPDLLYVTLNYEGSAPELYAVRKQLRTLLSRKKMFMEDIAHLALSVFEEAQSVTVALAFNRHVVTVRRIK